MRVCRPHVYLDLASPKSDLRSLSWPRDIVMPASSLDILIAGGGIAGLGVALALTEYISATPQVTVFELRPTPSTIGGAINLTPNALRYLDHLGVLSIIRQKGFGADINKIELFSASTGARVGEVDFSNASRGGHGFGKPPYKALRLARSNLLEALLEAVGRRPNIKVEFGKRVAKVEEGDADVTVHFGDGAVVFGDLLLGCDGIHSIARTFVDPSRGPVYTGIATAYGFTTIREGLEVSWTDTGLLSSRKGSFMSSYCEPSRTIMDVGAVMETEEVGSREGWKARGAGQDEVSNDIKERFRGTTVPALGALVEDSKDWYLYPV